MALSESSRVSCSTTLTYGLISLMLSRADWALDRPTSDCPWMTWRCRFDSSTTSKSMMPSVPTPAARPHDQDLGVLQPLLPRHPHVRDDQVTRVTPDLIDGQLIGRLDQRRQRHGSLQRSFLLNGAWFVLPAPCHDQPAGASGNSRVRPGAPPLEAARSTPISAATAPGCSMCATWPVRGSTTILAPENECAARPASRGSTRRSWLPKMTRDGAVIRAASRQAERRPTLRVSAVSARIDPTSAPTA